MDLLPILLHLSAIHLLMAMVPGPNTVAVSCCAAGISRRAGLHAAAGISCASLVWVSLSLAGVGLILMEAGNVYRAIRLAGAAYLLYTGFRLLRSSLGTARRTGDGAAPFYPRPFAAGFLTTLSNPKSAIFWTSVFALVVPAHAPFWFYGAVLALVGAQSFGWYATVALMLSCGPGRRCHGRLSACLAAVAGAAMGAFGLKIANDIRLEATRG